MSTTKDIKEQDITYNYQIKDVLNEISSIFNLSWPIIIGESFAAIPMVYNMRVAGYLGTYELAASTLSMTLFMILAMSPLAGILTALETLQSQTFTASKDPKWVGILAQRATLIIYLFLIPITLVSLKLKYILIWLGQDPSISTLAGEYMVHFLPCLPILTLVEILKRFMIVQGITKPSLIISIITAPIHVCLINYLTSSDGMNLGLKGIPITLNIMYMFHLTLYILSIKITGADKYYKGLSMEAFNDWIPFLKIAFPGMVMIAGAMWPIEFISFAVSYFGPAPLSSQAIINASFQLCGLILASLSLGSSIRVGNLLGAKLLFKCKLNTQVILGIGLILGLLFNGLLFFYRTTLISFFSKDPEVMIIAEEVLSILSFGLCFQSISILSGSILRGQGRQSIGAFFKLTSCYLVAIPLGWYLAIHYNLKLVGLWLGVIVSWIYCAIGEGYFVLTTDWQKEILNCQLRVPSSQLLSENDNNANYGAIDQDNLLNV